MKHTGPVRFILKGDADLAMRYTGRSRLLLQQAKDRMGPDKAYWNRTLPDGTEITVSSLGGVNQVWITTPAPDDVPFQKQGYLVLSSEEDQYYPIYKYNPYQVVNNPTEDTVAGNIEWVGRNATILSWNGGSNRYTVAGTGTAVYFRGSKYTDAPANVKGAAISNGHIIVATTSAMYHRPFKPTGYTDTDLYDEDLSPEGWREISLGALPLTGIVTALADYTGLKWTGKYSDTLIYDWILEYNSINNTFSVSTIDNTDQDYYSATFVNNTRLPFTGSGEIADEYNIESDYGDCFQEISMGGLNIGRDDYRYVGNFKYYLGKDYDSDGNLLSASTQSGAEVFYIPGEWRWGSAATQYFRRSYTFYGSHPDFYKDIHTEHTAEITQYWTEVLTEAKQTWTVGNLTRQCVSYRYTRRENIRTSPESGSHSSITDTTDGPLVSPGICTVTGPPSLPDFPVTVLGPPRESIVISSEILNSIVLYEDIRYSSAVALEYSDSGYTGDASIVWYVQDPDFQTNIQIAGHIASRANPPFNLMMTSAILEDNIFVSAGASVNSEYVDVHHIDIIPDGNDLLLIIDVTFYGERIINVYSKKNADTYITSGAITPGYTISEIKAL